MFDLGMSEMAILGVVALVVVGPKDLPKLAKEIGKIYRNMRGLAADFQSGLDQISREVESEVTEATTDLRSFETADAFEDYLGEHRDLDLGEAPEQLDGKKHNPSVQHPESEAPER